MLVINHKLGFMKHIILCLICCVFVTAIGAQNTQNTAYYVNQAVGSPIATNTVFVVQNNNYNVPGYWEQIESFGLIDNRVVFEITQEYDTTTIIDCNIKADVQVRTWGANDDPDGTPSGGFFKTFKIPLKVDSTGRSPIKDFLVFEDAQKLEIEILDVQIEGDAQPATMPSMRITGEIIVQEDRQFDCTQFPQLEHSEVGDGGDLKYAINLLSGGGVDGANYYDLEYVFYHYESEVGYQIRNAGSDFIPDFSQFFDQNATRVSLAGNNPFYSLPSTFPDGYLFYRMRAVNEHSDGTFQFSQWSSDVSGTLNTFSNYITISWFSSDLNWQLQTTFAEEGKRATSISYFDGTQRTRQTRTRVGSRILKQESIYDYQGRPVVQTLPSPQTLSFEGLEFLPNAMANINQAYSKDNFLLPDDETLPDPMSTIAGVGKYYSPSSNHLNGSGLDPNAAIPDAEGYPFSMVEFTPDATGRIRRQSGVGRELMLGRGHETKYYYGKPAQEELDRLFGNNIGLADHYEKNMIVDPNGQVSVSYIDASGRTIATALTGLNPAALTRLGTNEAGEEDYVEEAVLTHYDFLDNIRRENEIISIATLLVPENEYYNFNYALTNIPVYTSDCIDDQACYDCAYDLIIEITDDNGVVNHQGQNLRIQRPNYDISDLDLTCGELPEDVLEGWADVQLPTGEYKIIKRLLLNETVLERYLEEYTTTLISGESSCLFDIISQTLADYIFNNDPDCERAPCDACTSIRDVSDIVSTYFLYVDNGDGVASPEEEAAALQLHEMLLADCDFLCRENNECEQMRLQIINDMVPGGQYATYVEGAGGVFIGGNDVSIFAEGSSTGTYVFQSTPIFQDDDGNDVNLASIGSIEEFLEAFDLSWLEPLAMAHHPEWCVFEWCIAPPQDTYADYENRLYNESSFENAKDPGILPQIINNQGQFLWDNGGGNMLGDPFFLPTGLGATMSLSLGISYSDHLTNLMNDIDGAGNYTAVDVVCAAVYGVDIDTNPSSAWGSGDDVQNNRAWNALRRIYIAKRKEVKRLYIIENLAGTSHCGHAYFDCLFNELTDECSVNGGLLVVRSYPPIEAMLEDMIGEDICAEFLNNCTTSCETSVENLLNYLIEDQACVLPGVTMTTTLRASIKADLMAICVNGCDTNHPYGASTRSSFNAGINFSFEDVLDDYFDLDPCSAACNIYEQSIPPPYDANVYYGPSNVQVIVPDMPASDDLGPICEQVAADYDGFDCIASIITKWFALPDGPTNEELMSYFNSFTDVEMSEEQFYALLDYVTYVENGGDANDYTFPMIITLPPVLECQTCISCTSINSMVASFNASSSCSAEDYPAALTAYLNYELGWLLDYEDYEAFLNDCAVNPNAWSGNLCPEPWFSPVEETECEDLINFQAELESIIAYDGLLQQLQDDFTEGYLTTCLDNLQEQFTGSGEYREYHYTLYYYDQAGNLVQTVPPSGVNRLSINDDEDGDGINDVEEVAIERINRLEGTGPYNPKYPEHDLITRYQYNSLNQVVYKTCPDQSLPTNTWYDFLGRVVVSQDGRQFENTGSDCNQGAQECKLYSYTLYDNLGRVTEVGELETDEVMNNTIATSPAALDAWVNNADRRLHVTQTFYNRRVLNAPGFTNTVNTRNRVTAVSFEESYDGNDNTYDYATHYQYDIAGNVSSMIQDFPPLANTGNRYKRIDYEYDLISGSVHAVIYQEGESDQFTHRYEYDGENRLLEVNTSAIETAHSESNLWDRDASYSYYPHGPLQRTVLGEERVQGLDFVYSLQGWIKGLNSNNLTTARNDIGNDGAAYLEFTDMQGNTHIFPASTVARDVFGYSLNYFEGDYTPIGGANFEMNYANSIISPENSSLYNGNIRHMVNHFQGESNPTAFVYQYDQLHRILSRSSHQLVDANLNHWGGNSHANFGYNTTYRYDANGNILHLERSSFDNTSLDRLDYTIAGNSNQLLAVNETLDGFGEGIIKGDFNRSSSYTYDASGNLVLENYHIDESPFERTISWNPYGKVLQVDGEVLEGEISTSFDYDGSQNRVRRRFTDPTGSGKDTYYVRDAQGNVLAVYEHDHQDHRLWWREQHLYGSSRLGMWNMQKVVGQGAPVDAPVPDGAFFESTNTIYTSDFETNPLFEPNGIWEADPGFPSDPIWFTNFSSLTCSGGSAVSLDPTRAIRTRPGVDLQSENYLKLSFCFTTSMENTGDQIALEISHDDGVTYQAVSGGVWKFGEDFDLPLETGGIRTNFSAEVIVPGPFNSTTRLRIVVQPVSSGWAVIDDVTLEEGYIATCGDGIMNGDEEGVDCGGSNCEPCGTITYGEFTSTSTVYTSDFESTDPLTDSNGIWETDPDYPAAPVWLVGYPFLSCSGDNGISINQDRAIRTRSTLDLSAMEALQLSFCFSTGLDDLGDQITLEISYDDGATYQAVPDAEWKFGEDFDLPLQTGGVYTNFNASAVIPGPFNNTTRLRLIVEPVIAGWAVIDDVTLEEGYLVTCGDGIQNGDELGIDCGGAYCDPCYEYSSGEFTTTSTLYSSDFETVNPLTDPSEIWETDPDYPAAPIWLTNYSSLSCSGDDAISINQDRAIRTRSTFDLSGANNIHLSFCFTTGLDDPGDQIALEISHDNGLTYQSVTGGSWKFGEDFDLPLETGGVYTNFNAEVVVPGPFSSSTRLRLIAQPIIAGWVVIDDVVIEDGTLNLCGDGIQNGDEEGIDCGGSQCGPCSQLFIRGDKRYEITNHLGNVMAVITDERHIEGGDAATGFTYAAHTIRTMDYYPFGLEMNKPDTEFGDFKGYRYGFNGKEADNDQEWGNATHYDYGFRIYNPSIARFLSVDPLAPDYPWYTPYQFAGNKPIWAIDLDGLEEWISTGANRWKNQNGSIAWKSRDSDIYYMQVKSFLLQKTYISNKDNDEWLPNPIDVRFREDIRTEPGAGLSVPENYIKSNYADGMSSLAFNLIGGTLLAPLGAGTGFLSKAFSGSSFFTGASINFSAQLTTHTLISAAKGEFQLVDIASKIDGADIVFGGFTGGTSVLGQMGNQIFLPSLVDFTAADGLRTLGYGKSGLEFSIDVLSNSLFGGLGSFGDIKVPASKADGVEAAINLIWSKDYRTRSLSTQIESELMLGSRLNTADLHFITRMLKPVQSMSVNLGQYFDFGEQTMSNTMKEVEK